MNAQRLLFGLAAALAAVYLLEYLSLPFLDGPLFDSLVYLEQARQIRLGHHADPTLLAFSPLYGYFLAPFLGHVTVAVVAQLAMGLLQLWLLVRVTTRLFGERAAIFAGFALLLYGPWLFYETKVLSETLGLTLLLVALERLTADDELGAGVALALATLARASLLFMLPLFVLARMTRPKRAVVLAVAIAAPLVLHGAFVYGKTQLFVPVILVSSTAAKATHGAWTGDLDAFRKNGEAHVGAFSVVDQARARMARAARGEPEPAREGVSIAGWLRNVPGNLVRTFRDEETSFDYGFHGERSEVHTLRLTFVSFGMLACWALVGLAFARKDALPLLPIALGVLCVTTMFHPSARYRLPIVLALAPLAGLAWARADRRLRAALAAIAVVFVVHDLRRGLQHPGLWQLRVAESAAVAGDYATCHDRVVLARTLEPTPEVDERARYISRILRGCE